MGSRERDKCVEVSASYSGRILTTYQENTREILAITAPHTRRVDEREEGRPKFGGLGRKETSEQFASHKNSLSKIARPLPPIDRPPALLRTPWFRNAMKDTLSAPLSQRRSLYRSISRVNLKTT